MQVQRITVEYSQVIEVEVPSNDDLEAQFIVEEMLAQGIVKFATRELTEEVDRSDYYLANLADSDDKHFSEVVQVFTINPNDREKNLREIADFTDFPHGDYDETSKHDVTDFLKFCIENEYRRNAHLLDHEKIVLIKEE